MPALPSAPSKKSFTSVNSPIFCVGRIQIHRWSNGAGLGLGPKYSSSPLQKLRFPLCDLVDVHVELLRQLDQRLLAPHGSQSNSCLEGRAMVPAYSFCHRRS
ncbi:conserved hypothetical protein [Methylocella tundrae]|uniref:Uncharacterized protein n=1 Tax=Methylocella tundrae TaxID=227605 RepID=A0A8B6M9D6_METTU|nr:conserved hypothetical protein [Methylocella tundrae]VTZ51381.1 conserved hypothetical protein [Methylocella tundrae]